MAHGTPDYGVTAGAATTHQLTDLGELAVRLGSIDAFDRRGDVIWWDDFECGSAKWFLTGLGVGNAQAIATTHPRNGAQALELTAGSNGGELALARVGIAYQTLSRFGVEVSFGTDTLPLSVDVIARVYDGAQQVTAAFTWDRVAEQLLYWDDTGSLVPVASYTVHGGNPFAYNTVKIVWNAKTATYTRLIFNERAIDLAGIPLQAAPDPSAPLLTLDVQVLGRAAHNDTIHVDDVIITQNEPA